MQEAMIKWNKKYHPDTTNDNGEKMQQINDEYNKIYKRFKEVNND